MLGEKPAQVFLVVRHHDKSITTEERDLANKKKLATETRATDVMGLRKPTIRGPTIPRITTMFRHQCIFCKEAHILCVADPESPKPNWLRFAKKQEKTETGETETAVYDLSKWYVYKDINEPSSIARRICSTVENFPARDTK